MNINALIPLILPAAYYYRGRGIFAGRWVFVASVIACGLLTGHDWAILAGAGAYLGQMIPHGKYWDKPLSFGFIGLMRGVLIFTPLMLWLAIPVFAILHMLGWYLARKRNPAHWVPDYEIFTGLALSVAWLAAA